MSKLINISDNVYKKLTEMKGKESYTIVIEGLLSKKGNKEKILSLFGKGGIDEKKVKEAREYLRKWNKKYV